MAVVSVSSAKKRQPLVPASRRCTGFMRMPTWSRISCRSARLERREYSLRWTTSPAGFATTMKRSPRCNTGTTGTAVAVVGVATAVTVYLTICTAASIWKDGAATRGLLGFLLY